VSINVLTGLKANNAWHRSGERMWAMIQAAGPDRPLLAGAGN
jgi:hypothetical protein